MEQIYGRGARGKYHIAKEHSPLGYKAYCGEYIAPHEVLSWKSGEACKKCRKAYDKSNNTENK